MKRWRYAIMEYGVERWIPENALARLVWALSEIAVAVGYILMGMGIAWVLQVLHRGGAIP